METMAHPAVYPTKDELLCFIQETVNHVFAFYFALAELSLTDTMDDHPHDLKGDASKFHPRNLLRFALDYRRDLEIFQAYVFPAIQDHRKSYHHMRFAEGGDPYEMRVPATDIVVALRQKRSYKPGMSWEAIHALAGSDNFLPHQTRAIHDVADLLQKTHVPLKILESPEDLFDLRNPGIRPDIFYQMQERVYGVEPFVATPKHRLVLQRAA